MDERTVSCCRRGSLTDNAWYSSWACRLSGKAKPYWSNEEPPRPYSQQIFVPGMQQSTILQRNDVLYFPLPLPHSESHTKITLSVPTKSLHACRILHMARKSMSCPHPLLLPSKGAEHCKAEISIKSRLRWRQMRYPSCNVQRKSSRKTQLLIRTGIKISLNKYKERVHEGEQVTVTRRCALVSPCCPSPSDLPDGPSRWAGQLRTGTVASCRCSYLRHIRKHLSFPPLATLCPSGLQSVANTSSAWPGRSMASFFVSASQTFSVLSLLPLTSKRLSADQAI